MRNKENFSGTAKAGGNLSASSRSENAAAIQSAFTQQAAGFAAGGLHFSKQEYLSHVVRCIAPKKTDAVLDAAAGTCACGRAFAPFVRHVTCLDLTPAMLDAGRAAAEKDGLTNLSFVAGDTAALPFADASFDIVISRLAFHHFPEITRPFSEMARVLKPGGKLALIDMEAAPEPLRETEDALERLRDPSHVRNRSREELLSLFSSHGLAVRHVEATRFPVRLTDWLDFTDTPPAAREEITARLRAELSGGEKTGFFPYEKDGALFFDQCWLLILA